jgi:hypothetical protein
VESDVGEIIHLAQVWAPVFPPNVVGAAAIAAGALMALVCGLLQNRRSFLPWTPCVLFVLASTASYFAAFRGGMSGWVFRCILLSAGASLIAHLILGSRVLSYSTKEQPNLSAPTAGEGTRFYWYSIGIGIVMLASVFLLYDLGGYANSTLTWESSVIEGFANAYLSGVPVLTYARDRLQWDTSVLSSGHTSLYYGAPTYAILQVLGFSTWTLRACAALAALGAMIAVMRFGSLFLGTVAGTALTVAFALDPAVIFYGRYGSSPAGSLLGLVLALWATWAFLRRPTWWMAGLVAVTLFGATLNYATARPIVLALMTAIGAAAILEWRRWRPQLVGGIAVIAAAALFTWSVEGPIGQERFLGARGEQFFSMIQQPDTIKTLLGSDSGAAPRPDQLTMPDKVKLLIHLLKITVPQYLGIVLPFAHPADPGAIIATDPPLLDLYFPPLAAFIVLGLAHSVARWRQAPHLSLLLWGAAISASALLSSRVDAHRLMLLVVPLSVWAGLGVAECVRILRCANVPVAAGIACGLALIASLAYYSCVVQYLPQKPPLIAASTLIHLTESIDGPVSIGAAWDHHEIALLQLKLLEDARDGSDHPGKLLRTETRDGIQNQRGQLSPNAVVDLRRLIGQSTVILAPAERFTTIASMLEREGLPVSERGTAEFQYFVVERASPAAL